MRDTAPDPGSMKSASCNRVQVPEIRTYTRSMYVLLRAIITLASGLIIRRDDVKVDGWVGNTSQLVQYS